MRRGRTARFATVIAVAALACATVLLHGGTLRSPLVGDDYFFIEKAAHASFAQLLVPRQLVSNFYRPWSRELHFAALHNLVGLEPLAYHLVNLALAASCLVLFFLYARRLAGARVAAVATAGVASLSAWTLFVAWASCSQDLWMIAWSLLALHAAARDRSALATLAFALALLSKETAAMLPIVIVAEARLLRRLPWRSLLNHLVPLGVVFSGWLAMHPQFGGSLWYAHGASVAGGPHPTAGRILSGTLLSLVQLDAWPLPEHGWRAALLRALPAMLALLAFMLLAFRSKTRESFTGERRDRGRVAAVGAIWAVAAWLPLAMPTIGWHAYYGAFGALGAWLAIATLLSAALPAAALVTALLVALEAAATDTPTDDWGTTWFQRRAASFIGRAHEQLLARHPTLPPGSRLFFKEVPSGIGLLPGGDDSPVLRVWYGDPGLRASFMTRFTKRARADTLGSDYFFRHDAERGWIEIHQGAEGPALALLENPRWFHDHEQLASMLGGAGDWLGAKQEFEKLSAAAPDEAVYMFDLALSHCALGERSDAGVAFARVLAMPAADSTLRGRARRGCP